MDEDDKARLARQGLKAADWLETGSVSESIKGSVKEATGNAALKVMAAFGRMRGDDPPPRSSAREEAARSVDLDRMIDGFDAQETADFERRLQDAVSRQPSHDEKLAALRLSALRQSFPDASKNLALLIFNCVDLIEALSADAEGNLPSAEERARKEELLRRVAQLVARDAEGALLSFVDHVVALSRASRTDTP